MKIENMSLKEKYDYLHNKVYKNIKTTYSGKLYINTYYLRKIAKMAGGHYDELTKNQKSAFKSDIVFEDFFFEGGLKKYLKY